MPKSSSALSALYVDPSYHVGASSPKQLQAAARCFFPFGGGLKSVRPVNNCAPRRTAPPRLPPCTHATWGSADSWVITWQLAALRSSEMWRCTPLCGFQGTQSNRYGGIARCAASLSSCGAHARQVLSRYGVPTTRTIDMLFADEESSRAECSWRQPAASRWVEHTVWHTIAARSSLLVAGRLAHPVVARSSPQGGQGFCVAVSRLVSWAAGDGSCGGGRGRHRSVRSNWAGLAGAGRSAASTAA